MAVADYHWSYVLPDRVDPGFSETVGGASAGATSLTNCLTKARVHPVW